MSDIWFLTRCVEHTFQALSGAVRYHIIIAICLNMGSLPVDERFLVLRRGWQHALRVGAG